MALTRRRLLEITTASAAALALPLRSRKPQATPACEGLSRCCRRQTARSRFSITRDRQPSLNKGSEPILTSC